MPHNLLFEFATNKENNTLQIRREFAAERQLVWDCHTKSELLDRWFAPAPLTTKTKSMAFKEGGHWHYAMVDPEGVEYWGYIKYIRIQPIDYYTSTDAFSNENGEINQELPQAEWTVTFVDQGQHAMVETIVKYQSLEDLEKVLQMGVEQGMIATMSKLDGLIEELKKG